MLMQCRFEIEYKADDHKGIEESLEEYCRRTWSSRIHRLAYRNIGEPYFFYFRRCGGGKVIAVQKVNRRPFGFLFERFQIFCTWIGHPVNV